MTSGRAWTIAFVILAMTPLFFHVDGVRVQISDVAMPWRLVYSLLPGALAVAGAAINEVHLRRRRRSDPPRGRGAARNSR